MDELGEVAGKEIETEKESKRDDWILCVKGNCVFGSQRH